MGDFMEQIINELLHMDPSKISEYVNYFFLVLAAVGLIGFIIGFIKGLYKESSTFLVTAVYFVIVVIANKFISEAIYTLDISSILAQTGLGVPDTVKTTGDLLNHYFVSLCEQYGITVGNSEQLTQSIVAISLTVINLVVYLVLLLAGIIVCFILDMLVYLLIIRLIVPKFYRKKRKFRLVGGAMGLVRYVVAFSLLLSPFTAMANSVVGNLRDEDGKIQRNDLDNDFYNALMNVLEGYNNSTVAQMFFVVKDEDGKSIDVKLMDYVTQSKLDEETMISLYTEIGNFGSLALDAVATGAIDFANGINYSLLLGADFVGSAIDTIANSTLIKTILSVGLTLVTNMDSLKEKVDLSSVDFYYINWDSTLEAVKTAYEELYKSGVIDEVIVDPEAFLNEFYLDSDYGSAIKTALMELGNNDLICQIMPPLVVSFLKSMKESSQETQFVKRSNSFEISDELLDTNTYKDIKWGSELASIYEVFENISEQYYAYENKHLTISDIETLGPDTLLNTLFGVGVDFSSVDDTSYADQYENNVFVNGGTYENNGVTHEIEGTKNILGTDKDSVKGFFNLQIIEKMFEHNVFNDLISILDINSMLEVSEDDVNLNEKVIDIVKEWDKKEWQQELDYIVDVVAPIMNLVDIIGLDNPTVSEAKRANQEQELDLATVAGDDSLNCLKRLTDVLENSKIFNEILPDVLEAYTDKQTDEIFAGLSMSDLNFTYFVNENTTMISELRRLVDQIDNINEDLIDLLDNLENQTDAVNSLVDDCSSSDSVFGSLLKIIEDNKIINKDLTSQEKLDGEYKTFTKVMASILGKTDNPDDEINVYNMTEGKVIIEKETIYNFDKQENGWKNEIDGLVGFIGSLKGENGEDQMILDFISGAKEVDFANDIYSAGNEIERIFSSIDDSIILKEAFPTTIDNLIGDAFNDLLGTGPKFTNIESWSSEGRYFNLLLTNINDIKDGQDISAIDWLNVDSGLLTENAFDSKPSDFKEAYSNSYATYFIENSKINKLLTSLYDSQCIGGKYTSSDRENGVFHTMLKTIMSTAFEALDIKIESDDTTVVLQEELISKDFDIDGNEKVVYDFTSNGNIYVSWLGDPSSNYVGEIGNISMMINSVSDLQADATIEDMDSILEKINRCYILRNTLPLIIDSKTKDIGGEDNTLLKDFVDRSDFTVFHKKQLSLTPYEIIDDTLVEQGQISTLSTRISEIEARQEELDTIVNILNDAENVSSNMTKVDGADPFSSIKNLLENDEVNSSSTKEISDVESILTNMHNSKIFNAVDKFTENGVRTDLTAFEYFFEYALSHEALLSEVDKNGDGQLNDRVFTIPDRSFFYSLTESNGWINNGEVIGEIKKFNDGLYEFIDNPLIDIVTKSQSDFIGAVADTLKDEFGNPLTPIQDLLMSLHGSSILDLSTAKILDEDIYKHIYDAIDYQSTGYTTNTFVNQTYVQHIGDLITNLYELKGLLVSKGWSLEEVNGIDSLDDVMKYIWMNEARQIEYLMKSLDEHDLNSLDITNIDSDFVADLTDSFNHSLGLNYLEMTSNAYENGERSAYQLVIIRIINSVLDAFDNNLGLYTNNVSDILIKDYDLEAEVSIELMDAYNKMNDDEIDFAGGNVAFGNDSSKAKAFMELITDVVKPLYKSDVYHNDLFINARPSKTIGEDAQLSNLTIFEQIIYTLLSSSTEIIDELYTADSSIEYSEVVYDSSVSEPEINADKNVLNLRIREVTALEQLPNPEVNWITYTSGNELDSSCEIAKLKDIAGQDMTFDSEHFSLHDYVTKDSNGNYNGILNKVNAFYVLHDIVPNTIYDFVSKKTEEAGHGTEDSKISADGLLFLVGLDSNDQPIYQNEKGYAGEKIDTYLIEHEFTSFTDKVDAWNNDLDLIKDIIDLLNRIEENGNDIRQLLSIDDPNSKLFGDLLPLLNNTHTYKDGVPQFIITILEDWISVDVPVINQRHFLAEFISIYNDEPYGTVVEEKLLRMKTMFKEIESNSSYAIDSSKPLPYNTNVWEDEGKGIDSFIRYVISRVDTDLTNDLSSSTVYGQVGKHMSGNASIYFGA